MAAAQKGDPGKAIREALANVFVSPNEGDSNDEPANVVDGLFAIARAIERLADVVQGMGKQQGLEVPHHGP
jgi:hypothetical protein